MRRIWLSAVRITGLLILLLYSPSLAAADGPVINIDPADTPLVIEGTLDGQTTSFSGNMRLTLTGGDAAELRLLPSDLHHAEDSDADVDRTGISIPTGTGLSAGQPRDVRVTVSNVTHPGHYTGELKLLVPDQDEADALVIPLELHIDAVPDVEPATDNLALEVVRCRTAINCFFATLLLPDSVARDEWAVPLDNRTLIPIQVTGASVVVRGDNTGSIVSSSDIALSVPTTLPASQIENIDLTIRRNHLPADHYQGTLRFKLEDASDPVIVNLDLNVRDGPLWPIIITLLGIVVGRLVRSMETPEIKKESELLRRFFALQAEATAVKEPSSIEHLQAKLRSIKREIEAGQKDGTVTTQALDKLDARIRFLVSLESLEDQLHKSGQDALLEELRPKLHAARVALLNERIEDAERLRQEAENRLREVRADGTMGAAADLFSMLLDSLRDSGERLTEAETAPPPAPPGGARWGWLAKLMAAVSGVRLISADVRYWLVRPLLWLVLLILLLLLGLQTLYVNAGTTFGAAGLYDYLGLFLWGISADVAQRTLQNLELAS